MTRTWIKAVTKVCLVSAYLLVGHACVQAPARQTVDITQITNDKHDVEPFKIFENLYYVGDKWVSSYLIETSEGYILVDTSEAPYGRRIPRKLRYLGLNPADIKFIVITHGHSDHVGGAKYLQDTLGAQVVITGPDLSLAAEQSANSVGKYAFVEPRGDVIATDNSTITLGNTKLNLYVTPGHTRGCLSLDFLVYGGGEAYRAFIICGMGTNFSGADQLEQYIDSVQRFRKLNTVSEPVTVNLANHPRMAQLLDRKSRMEHSEDYHPFVDPDGFLKLLDTLEARGQQKKADMKSENDKNNSRE